MKDNHNKDTLKLLKKLTKGMVEKESKEWPPVCSMILHQPKRPK